MSVYNVNQRLILNNNIRLLTYYLTYTIRLEEIRNRLRKTLWKALKMSTKLNTIKVLNVTLDHVLNIKICTCWKTEPYCQHRNHHNNTPFLCCHPLTNIT